MGFNVVIVMFVCCIALNAAAQEPAATEPLLGGPGETCRAKSDCAAGLKCMANACRHEMDGASCTARADCGGELMCINSVCVPPGAAPNAPATTAAAQLAAPSADAPDEAWTHSGREGFDGVHPHGGLMLGGGPTVGIGFGGSATVGGFLFALKGGVLIDRIELGLEFSPVTFLPYTGTGAQPVLQMNAYGGYHIPVYGPISWPLRAGIGFAAVNLPSAALEARFDLIGISALFGPVLLDVYLPTFRVLSDFDNGTALHFTFGIGGAVLPAWF